MTYGWTPAVIRGLSDEEALAWMEASASRPGGGHRVGPPARSIGEIFARDQAQTRRHMRAPR